MTMRSRDRLRNRADTPEQLAWRLRYNAAREQMELEKAVRYPEITPENAREMIAWQENRLRELMRES